MYIIYIQINRRIRKNVTPTTYTISVILCVQYVSIHRLYTYKIKNIFILSNVRTCPKLVRLIQKQKKQSKIVYRDNDSWQKNVVRYLALSLSNDMWQFHPLSSPIFSENTRDLNSFSLLKWTNRMQALSSCSINCTCSKHFMQFLSSHDFTHVKLIIWWPYHIRLRLVLHSHHPNEDLIALNFETTVYVAHIIVFVLVAQQGIYRSLHTNRSTWNHG